MPSTINVRDELFPSMSDQSKLWIYILDRDLSDDECHSMMKELKTFCANWTSHQESLKSEATILFNRMVIIGVDEAHREATGCSIDNSIHFLRQLGNAYRVGFFNRQICAVWNDGRPDFMDIKKLAEMYAAGIISDTSMVVDHLVKDKKMV